MKTTVFAILVMALSVLAAPAAAGQSAGEINACKAEILQVNNITEATARQLPVGFPIEYGGSIYPLAPGSNPWALCRDELIPAEVEQALRDEIAVLEFQIAELQEENQELRQQSADTNIVSSQISTQIAGENVVLNTSGSSGGGNTNIVSSQLSTQIAAGNLEINQLEAAAGPEVSTAPHDLPILEWIMIGLLLLGTLLLGTLFWRYRERMERAVSQLRSQIKQNEATQHTLSQTIKALRESHNTLSEAHDRLHETSVEYAKDNARLDRQVKQMRQDIREQEAIEEALVAEIPMTQSTFKSSIAPKWTRPLTLIYDGRDVNGTPYVKLAHGKKFLFLSPTHLLRALTTVPSLEVLGRTRPYLNVARLREIRHKFEKQVGKRGGDYKTMNIVAQGWLSDIFDIAPTPQDFRFPVAIHPKHPVDTIPDPVESYIPADVVMQ